MDKELHPTPIQWFSEKLYSNRNLNVFLINYKLKILKIFQYSFLQPQVTYIYLKLFGIYIHTSYDMHIISHMGIYMFYSNQKLLMY